VRPAIRVRFTVAVPEEGEKNEFRGSNDIGVLKDFVKAGKVVVGEEE